MFIDPKRRFDNFGLAFNYVNHECNQKTYNDGYHIIHHMNSLLHWSLVRVPVFQFFFSFRFFLCCFILMRLLPMHATSNARSVCLSSPSFLPLVVIMVLSQVPQWFEDNIEKFAIREAIVFNAIDTMQAWLYVVTGNWKSLHAAWVDLSPGPKRTVEEFRTMMEERMVPLDGEPGDGKYD